MADLKISQLTAITTLTPATDVLPVVDSGGVTKKITTNQILGSGGTATLASATITGDLTVRTNKLAVTSTGVGVGTTSVLADLNIQNGSNCRCEFASQAGGTVIENLNNARNAYLNMTMYADAYIWNRLGTTAMTLNSTGLGVGGAPLSGFRLNVNNGDFRVSDVQNEDGVEIGWSAGSSIGFVQAYNRTTSAFKDLVLNAAVTINAAGNVGIGVAPSAAIANNRKLEIVGTLNSAVVLGSNSSNASARNWATASNWNAYGDLAFLQSNALGGDPLASGAGTTRMTLDASGNLLVGKTARDLINAGVEILPSGQTTNIVASSVGGFTTLEVYSTTAAAYRFYVGMNGTISATNTVISAISDARLKENVQDIDVGLGAILALKPRKFDWKEGKGKDIKGDRGFIAQEFEQVFPQLVDDWKDAAPEGEAPYKSVRQDLIPVLVKAIQELTARVQTLETR